MKIICLVCVFFVCCYIGIQVSNYYKTRQKFFKNLYLVFEKLSLEINFNHNSLIEILQKNDIKNKDISKLIENFIFQLEKNEDLTNEKLFNNIKILKEEEKELILIYFSSLGKLDVFNQTKQLESQKNEIKIMADEAEKVANKNASLSLKLGILAGLCLIVIFY